MRREEAALHHLRQEAEILEEEQRLACELWVEGVLEHASEVGFDANGSTWTAVQRVRARLNGEAFEAEQVCGLWGRLSHWDIW